MIFDLSLFLIRLLDWFDRNRRDLPWRLPPDANADARPDPYLVFVSEAMLQQTQVVTVIPYFHRFIEAFPTVEALADADEQSVLRMWQGLGYYSRARNLQRAARFIVQEHGGQVPERLEDLLQLPGVGRYTAGAIASIAYGRRAPILDGNVARVLCRINQIESDPRDRVTRDRLWERAEQILPPEGQRVGDVNSALMELGAMVCTPRNPQCLICPVRSFCRASQAGVQDRIPLARKTTRSPLHQRCTFCIRCRGRYLIEQRPARGRWAGMWQFVTVEKTRQPVTTLLKSALGIVPKTLTDIGIFSHSLTHRRYQFHVFSAEISDRFVSRSNHPRVWVRLADLVQYPLPRPHLRIAQLLQAGVKAAKSVKP